MRLALLTGVAAAALSFIKPLTELRMEQIRDRAFVAMQGKGKCWWNPPQTTIRARYPLPPKSLAPEPYMTAVAYLLYEVSLFLRSYHAQLEERQLFDLADAIHNLPMSLVAYNPECDIHFVRDLFLSRYDSKWVRSKGDFSLVTTLNEGILRATSRGN